MHIELGYLDLQKTCLELNLDLVGQILGRRAAERKFSALHCWRRLVGVLEGLEAL